MDHSPCRYSRSKIAIIVAVATLGTVLAEATPACSVNYPLVTPLGWEKSMRDVSASTASTLQSRNAADVFPHGIVGTWRVTFVSDGSAYPGPIPAGAIVDFGTVQWHTDGTEFMISGGRPPSSGDVCMGVWQQTGPSTYELKHLALAYVSSDTLPPIGPASPAVFLGPAIIHEIVTLDQTRMKYTGTFTIDQYATDEETLLEHVGGTLTATRFTVE